MKFRTLTISTCFLLIACTQLKQGSENAADTVGNESSASWNDMRDLLGIGHPPSPRPEGATKPRYCYRTAGDVLCYDRPIPGQEYRLTGYQDAHGHTGYVLPYNYEMPGDTPPKKKKKSTTGQGTDSASPLPVPGGASPPAAAPQKQLKEVIFDPSELEPHDLVPEKQQ